MSQGALQEDRRLAEIAARLEAARAELLSVLATVPASKSELRVADDRWSVAEVVQHLALAEARIISLLVQAETAAPFAGAAEEPYTIALEVVLDRTRRIETRDTLRPDPDVTLAEARARLVEVRARLQALVARADANALAALSHPHAALGRMNGLQWLDFIGGHEARHTAQIRETLAALR